MSGVDDSIVEMKFDNVKFQQKMEETLRSLDKLRSSLDFSSGKKSMDDLSKASKDFNMNSMGTSLENVSRGFLALSTVAITVLSQITQAAFTSGLSVVKAFTFAPIMDGFTEFETNMNSIQTILANTKSDGSTLEDVNGALETLNKYSDQTIYNFSQMARNIGTFTAAGVNLKDSTDAIKGIANLAAISGSNSEQASTAMYQLSQALAAGKVSLMDWNSVVNAGMGGEVFKKALFETGKAMGTITDVPLSASFEEWEKKGGTFREQMQKGWITADVLKTSLGAFSGELDKNALKAMGFSDAAAAEMEDLGKLGIAAATEVKTMTQLIGTVKESIASGWSATFKTVIGDFEESKELFTDINSAIGNFVSKSADGRNNMLKIWKDFGGRTALIEGFKNAFSAIGNVLSSVGKAFRVIFPKKSAEDLLVMTKRFVDFTEKLETLSVKYMPTIKRLFVGLFSAISIVKEVVKGVAGLFVELFKAIGGEAGGPALAFFGELSDRLFRLHTILVNEGGIKKFFETLKEGIREPGKFIDKLVQGVKDLFDAFNAGGDTSAIDNVNSRFEHIKNGIKKVTDAWDWLVEKTEGVRQALGDLWNYIMQFFRELGDSMKSEMNQGDFEGALDIFNVAFLGGIALMIRKFFKNGFQNLGGGIVQKINGILDQTTGVLKAMQTELKAKALMEIAIAMGVLTLSLVALSMIDSAALTKALVAMAAGFTQLVVTMTAIEQLTSMSGAFKFGVVAAGMIALAAAMVILSAAVKVLSTLSWSELVKGLVGVAGGLAAMVTAMNRITADTKGLIRAGIAMSAIAIALRILANAMQAFATMGWEELAKGFAGIAGGLLALVTAMNRVPTEAMIQAGVGIIAIAVGMRILANAMQAFATMSWEEMAKGLIAVAAALGIIVVLTNTMPAGGLVGIGIGLIGVAVSLRIIAEVVEELGKMKIGTMAKGLGGLAAMLLMLAVATNAMNGAVTGAAAMVIVSGAMLVMATVLEKIGKLEVKELVIGLVGLAAVLALLGGAAYLLTPVIPQMIALGIAIGLLGAGFALFGAGAFLVIKAFELLGKVGKKSMLVLIELIAIFMARAPLIGIAIARVIVAAATDLAEAAPALIKALKVVLLELLEAVIELAPKIGEAAGAIITTILKFLQKHTPELVKTGFQMLMDFLRGIRDNMYELVVVGAEIMVNFMTGLASRAHELVDAAVRLLQSFLSAIGARAGDIVAAGLKLLTDFLSGISMNINQVITVVTDIILNFVAGIANNAMRLVQAGADTIIYLMQGIASKVLDIVNAAVNIVIQFVTAIGDNAGKLVTAGTNVLIKFLFGITNNLTKVTNAVGTMIAKFITALGENASKIATAGADAVIDFLDGVQDDSRRVIRKFAETGVHLMETLADNIVFTVDKAGEILVDFLNALADSVDEHAPEIRKATLRLATAIIDGITGGLASKAGKVVESVKGIAGDALSGAANFLGIGGPSTVFCELGKAAMLGFAGGFDAEGRTVQQSAMAAGSDVVKTFQKAIETAHASLPVLDNTNPVITPVLDLSEVRKAATGLDEMMNVSTIRPDVSIDRARALSVATEVQNGSDEEPVGGGDTYNHYEQNIHAPEALSTAEIYRQSKSLFAMEKEELGVA